MLLSLWACNALPIHLLSPPSSSAPSTLWPRPAPNSSRPLPCSGPPRSFCATPPTSQGLAGRTGNRSPGRISHIRTSTAPGIARLAPRQCNRVQPNATSFSSIAMTVLYWPPPTVFYSSGLVPKRRTSTAPGTAASLLANATGCNQTQHYAQGDILKTAPSPPQSASTSATGCNQMQHNSPALR